MCRYFLFFDVKIDDKLISCTALKIKVFFIYAFLIIVFNRIIIFLRNANLFKLFDNIHIINKDLMEEN